MASNLVQAENVKVPPIKFDPKSLYPTPSKWEALFVDGPCSPSIVPTFVESVYYNIKSVG